MVLQIGNEFNITIINSEIDLPELYSNCPDLVSAGSKFASIPYRSVQVGLKNICFRRKKWQSIFRNEYFFADS